MVSASIAIKLVTTSVHSLTSLELDRNIQSTRSWRRHQFGWSVSREYVLRVDTFVQTFFLVLWSLLNSQGLTPCTNIL